MQCNLHFQATIDIVKHAAKDESDKALVPRMEKFLETMVDEIDKETTPSEDGFNVLIHNDLHMTNVMYT